MTYQVQLLEVDDMYSELEVIDYMGLDGIISEFKEMSYENNWIIDISNIKYSKNKYHVSIPYMNPFGELLGVYDIRRVA